MPIIQFQSTKEFVSMLAMYKLAGTWLLPDWMKKYALTADEYLDVRDRWEREDMVILDFDGLLHPTRKLARMMYNVKHGRSVMKFEDCNKTIYYVLGPVDILYLENAGEIWFMKLCTAGECQRFVKEKLEKETTGCLTTMTLDDVGEPTKKMWQLDGSEAQEAALREHIKLFYEHKWIKQV